MRFLLASTAGVFGGLIFLPAGLDWFAWFFLIPLLLILGRVSVRRALVLGWLTGVVGHSIAFGWLWSAVARLQEVSLATALPPFLLFVAYHGLQVGLFAAAVAALRRPALLVHHTSAGRGTLLRSTLAAMLVAATWTALEWIFPKIFPWSLAWVVTRCLPLVQIAELTGIWGISFVVVFINAALAQSLAAFRSPASSARWQHIVQPLMAPAVLLVAVWSYGAWRLIDLQHHSPLPVLNALMVQGNLPAGRRDAASEDQSFSIYRELTRRELQSAAASDVVIWPETTLRVVLPEHESFRRRVDDVAAALKLPLIIGSLDRAADGVGQLNSLFVVSPQRVLAGVYHKQRLLPFGEYIPFGLPWWRTTAALSPGKGGAPISLPQPQEEDAPTPPAPGQLRPAWLLAPSICYEALWPGIFNSMVASGAQVLVNITDDSWLGDGVAPSQHLQGAILRSIETRRTMLRASNSGISAVIQSTGEVTQRTELHARAVLHATGPLASTTTLYVRWGDWFAAACALVAIAYAIADFVI
jgi:apolipoprotein N-acyltransferase